MKKNKNASLSNYFPDKIFSEIHEINDLMMQLYSNYLKAMKEPSFLKMSQKGNLHGYRLLWLRSFSKPICIRIDINPDDSAMLTSKMTSGYDGYDPGKLIINKSHELPKDKVQTFLDFLERSNYWSMKTEDINTEWLDGDQWILEGIKGNKYHIANHWCSESEVFRDAALYLIDISQLKIGEIY